MTAAGSALGWIVNGVDDVQYEIMVQRFIKRKSIVAITYIVHLTEDGVNDNIAKAYDSILGVLKRCGKI